MKPLARFTITNCVKEGFDCLKHSIILFKKHYPEFDIVVCYNNMNPSLLNVLNVETVNQHQYSDSLPYAPWDTTWKLYPPRLRIDSHEVFIDNDLIFHRRLPIIDKFLSSNNQFLITQAHDNSYGNYGNLINFPIKTNSGFMGFPPSYDLKEGITSFTQKFPKGGWVTHNDDEAVITYLMLKENMNLISLDEVYACNKKYAFKLGKYGTHFVSLNTGFIDYWKRYRSSFLL